VTRTSTGHRSQAERSRLVFALAFAVTACTWHPREYKVLTRGAEPHFQDLLKQVQGGALGAEVTGGDAQLGETGLLVLHRRDGSSTRVSLLPPERALPAAAPRYFEIRAGSDLSADERRALAMTLDSLFARSPWATMRTRIEPSAAAVTLASAAFVLAFVLAGALAGRGIRRLHAPAWAGPASIVLFPAIALLSAWVPMGFWDLALGGCIAGLAAWIAFSAQHPWKVAAGVSAVLLIGLGLIEAMVRLSLTAPARIPFESPSSLFLEPESSIVARGEIPRSWERPHDDVTAAGIADRAYIAHLGDSMIEGAGVPRELVATTALEQLLPSYGEANLGMAGTGPDIQYVELFRWLDEAAHQPVLVVQHFFTGNDIEDIDQDRQFCRDGAVLEYESGGPVPCRHLAWHWSLHGVLSRARAPYVLRGAAAFSVAARHAMTAFALIARDSRELPSGSIDPVHDDVRWNHIEQILRAERDELQRRGIACSVAILPYRPALEGPEPEKSVAWQVRVRMLGLLNRLNIPALDAWPVFAEAARTSGPGALFLAAPDVHFSAEGHRVYARWLAGQLPRLIDLRNPSVSTKGP
jgi:hypothetical protein